MGIKDLNGFLREAAPDSFRLIEISSFARKRIAVDATLLLYQSFSAAMTGIIKTEVRDSDLLKDKILSRKKDENTGDYTCEVYKKALFYVFNRVNGFVWEMIYHGITPVFIYDGPAIHEKNSYARERRKQARVAAQDRIAALKKQILDTPLLERSGRDFTDLRKFLSAAPPIKPYKDFPQFFTHLAGNLGVPCLEAPNEAEKFCAYLASAGIAVASYTTDTDSYVFGAPIVLSAIDQETKSDNYNQQLEAAAAETAETGDPVHVAKKECSTHFCAVVTPMIINRLKLTQRQFVDFCIMLGCDFNSRVPGVGPKRSWKLLNEVLESCGGSDRVIEKVAEANPKFEWGVLAAERCREIFTDMQDCVDCLDKLLLKSPDRNIFNIRPKSIKNTELKRCYVQHFSPKHASTGGEPEEVEYI